MPTSASVLTKLRRICSSLPDVTEGAHVDAIAFKARGAMFATYRPVGADSEIVFALEPDHMDALIAEDARFKRYSRARAVVIRGSDVRDWTQMSDFLHESHKLVATKRAAKSRKAAATARRAGRRKAPV